MNTLLRFASLPSRRLAVLMALVLAVLDAPTSVMAIPISGKGTWETTLQARDLDGDLSTAEAYYDTVLDITWLDVPNPRNGFPFFDTWQSVIGEITIMNVGGITGWRLPNAGFINGVSFNSAWSVNGTTDVGLNISAPGSLYGGSIANEMAHLYYNTLGNLSQCDPVLSGSTTCSLQSPGAFNTGLFSTLLRGEYWSATSPGTNLVVTFDTIFWGEGVLRSRFDRHYALAVHSGDVGVAVVPVPETHAMVLVGLAFLGVLAKYRKRQTQ
jgi:hypothetical protein